MSEQHQEQQEIQEPQQAEATEVPAQSDSVETGQSESLILGKFKSAADLEAAYLESEKALRQTQQANHELKTKLEAPQERQQVINEVQDDAEEKLFIKEWMEDPAKATYNRTVRAEQRARNESRFTQAYAAMKSDESNYPGFSSYEKTMNGIATKYGYLINPDQALNPEIAQLLYYAAKGIHGADGKSQTKSKASAFGEGSSVTSTPKRPQDMSLEELEKKVAFHRIRG